MENSQTALYGMIVNQGSGSGGGAGNDRGAYNTFNLKGSGAY
jgi:hypothetical protein